jgi:hypothetical protein
MIRDKELISEDPADLSPDTQILIHNDDKG